MEVLYRFAVLIDDHALEFGLLDTIKPALAPDTNFAVVVALRTTLSF
jgi:hypothetical protein